MARIRSLKPGFFSNEQLADLSPWHRLCFAGLWTIADREGRLEDRPRRIKAAVFPYDDLDIDGLLNGLSEYGFIIRYVADGVPCIAIPTFERHQRPKSDEHPSALPAPILEHPRGNSTGPRSYKGDSGTLGQRTEGGGADGAPAAADGADLLRETADGAGAQRRAEDFATLWNSTTNPPIPRCRDITTKRRRQVKTRLAERPFDEWTAVFARIQDSAFCRGQNDRGWVATFDWVIGCPDVAVKVLEGKYDDRASAARTPDRPFTANELADARRVRANWSGHCRHEPPCENARACEAAIIRQWRRERSEVA